MLFSNYTIPKYLEGYKFHQLFFIKHFRRWFLGEIESGFRISGFSQTINLS
jgi:hypothetical protein